MHIVNATSIGRGERSKGQARPKAGTRATRHIMAYSRARPRGPRLQLHCAQTTQQDNWPGSFTPSSRGQRPPPTLGGWGDLVDSAGCGIFDRDRAIPSADLNVLDQTNQDFITISVGSEGCKPVKAVVKLENESTLLVWPGPPGTTGFPRGLTGGFGVGCFER